MQSPRRSPAPQACTGLFTDYHWRDTSPTTAATHALALHALQRLNPKLEHPCSHLPRDVWMGVDVYGRGTWGGGGMDSDKAVARAVASGASAALFAAAWAWCEHGEGERARKDWEFWSRVHGACAAPVCACRIRSATRV
jgi:mannosyl-glycoprotein endo-beta-N-acetylglucosaminidase